MRGSIIRKTYSALLLACVLTLSSCALQNNATKKDSIFQDQYIWSFPTSGKVDRLCFSREGAVLLADSHNKPLEKWNIYTGKKDITAVPLFTDCNDRNKNYEKYVFRKVRGGGYVFQNPIVLDGGINNLSIGYDGTLTFGITGGGKVPPGFRWYSINMGGSDYVIFGPNDKYLITSGTWLKDPILWIFEHHKRIFLKNIRNFESLQITEDSNYVLYLDKDGNANVVDTRSKVYRKYRHNSEITLAHISNNLSILTTYSPSNNTLKTWAINKIPMVANFSISFAKKIKQGFAGELVSEFNFLALESSLPKLSLKLIIHDHNRNNVVKKWFSYDVNKSGKYVFRHKIPVPHGIRKGTYYINTELYINDEVMGESEKAFLVIE